MKCENVLRLTCIMIVIELVLQKPHKRPDIFQLQPMNKIVHESNNAMITKELLNETERLNEEMRARFEEITKDYDMPMISIPKSKSELKPDYSNPIAISSKENIGEDYIDPIIIDKESESDPNLKPMTLKEYSMLNNNRRKKNYDINKLLKN